MPLLREEMIATAASDPSVGVEDCALRVLERFAPMLPEAGLELLAARLISGAAGLGPLDELLRDEEVEEVMVNGPTEVWVERGGRLERTTASFDSVEVLRDSVDRMLSSAGRRVDDTVPMADARLPDGSRVNVTLPPLAVGGPIVTIRRFRSRAFDLDELERLGTVDPTLSRLLAAAVEDGLNILVSGATGSGKTTTLAALAGRIPKLERVVTIEDAAELKVEHPHLVRLEARPAAPSGAGLVTIRDLVRNALRMRPDRIVVGEVRGAEAIDMLDAMATGHAGSLSTIHAASPAGALDRLAGLVHMSGSGLPHAAVMSRIASAIDIVVQQKRFPDGGRVVERVAVVGGDPEPEVGDIFRLESGVPRWRVAGSVEMRSRLRLG